MNPLTLVKRIQNINKKEASLGISDEASWHAKYKDSAYVFVGGIPFDLTEGDLLAVFAQYGEIVDVNLVRDKGTGKSKGFAFVAYEDQRSTNLAVDNLNGAQILGRTIRVDHVVNYKKKQEEDEEEERKKREARGVCRAFQKGECTRGDGCRFSHDEQRAANTGWGPKDNKDSKWGHDNFDGPKKGEREKRLERPGDADQYDPRSRDRDSREMSSKRNNDNGNPAKSSETRKGEERRSRKHGEDEIMPKSREGFDRREEKRSRRHDDGNEFVRKSREDLDRRDEKRSRRNTDDESLPTSREDHYSGEERRSRKRDDDEFQPNLREDQDRKEGERSRRHNYDESEPAMREHNHKRTERRSGRNDDDQFEPKSRKDYERSDNKRSRYYE
ncbi:hypothetical protein UlMin_013207 [Ulmus minor]